MTNAAATVKQLTLELGGSWEMSNLNKSPKDLFWGAFINSGQVCAAIKRLYIDSKIYDTVCHELVEFAKKIPMGIGTDSDNLLGPIQNRRQYEKALELTMEAIKEGTVLLGGKGEKEDQKGYFFPVTIIGDLDNGDRLVDEEQFGPVLPIIKFSDPDEALEKANDNPHRLGGSV